MAHVLVAKETRAGETRVSATPETVRQMIKRGFTVSVEEEAGEASFFRDPEYAEAGATLVPAGSRWGEADLVLCVQFPEQVDDPRFQALREGATVIGFVSAHKNPDVVREASARKLSLLAMELVPRITRAQKMDALSSQANIAGYKAAVLGASNLPKYFPMLMTAAGTVKPAKVVVMGAGVAGLQAIATAKRLGAVVEASDIRPAVKEQVESLGAKFIEPPKLTDEAETAGGYAKEVTKEYLARQQEVVAERVAQADVVITTALVPGRKAPVLIPADTVQKMRPGSVIVDLAVEQGGNCELSELNQHVRKHGVLIIGEPNLPATVPHDASMLYARNVVALAEHLLSKEGALELDLEDEITGGTLLTHAGRVIHAPTAEALGLSSPEEKKTVADDPKEAAA